MSKRAPNALDIRIGKNIKIYRHASKTSQERTAAALGVRFQQLQKYEKGKNRIAASKLFILAQLFKIDINEFFY